ncbi:MAG: hypothetical protein ABI451_03990 [Dokdonella sp.]
MPRNRFLRELRRRHVFRVAGAYAVTAWVIIEVTAAVVPALHLPDAITTVVVLLALLGFPLAVVLAWAYELTAEGVQRAGPWQGAETSPSSARPASPGLGSYISILTIATLVIAIGYLAWAQFFAAPAGVAPEKIEQAVPSANAVSDKSVAVLPFENLSRDPENAYFVDGIRDEILTRLAKVSALKVISRTSTMRYASRPDNLRDIARQLGVAHILEGSVQRAGGTVRINLQLIDAASDSHRWAETYDRAIEDVFSVESEVAQAVANALKANLLPAESARIARVPTSNPEAYDRFLRAEYFLYEIVATSFKDPAKAAQTAAEMYAGAIAADPQFALAYARLSYLNSIVYWFGIDSSAQVIDKAQADALRALALQPDLAEAHLAMGYFHYWGHRDYAAALAEFANARASLPNDPNVLTAIARVHRRQGKLEQAIPEFEQAGVLDPRNTDIAREIGVSLTCLRRYAEADAAFDRSIALAPDNAYAYVYRAGARQMRGDLVAARRVLEAIPPDLDPQGAVSLQRFLLAMGMRDADAALAVLAKAPDWLNDGTDGLLMPASLWRGQAFALKGDSAMARAAFADARHALETKLRTSREPAGIQSYLAIAYAGLGQRDAALKSGRLATKLLPITEDALGGAWYLYQLAAVEAHVGEPGLAVDHIRQLLAAPAGFYVSSASLHTDPAWDPLRREESFQGLLQSDATNPAN